MTPLATVQLPGNMLKSSEVSAASTIGVSVKLVDKSVVSDARLKEKIGDRPILEINLKVDGKLVKYDNPLAAVSIAIPYQPSEQELQDPDHIVVWYMDGKGNAEEVPNGQYDKSTGMVTFRTTHFSKYAISYEHKSFEDLGGYEWAKQQIETLASKDIIHGTSEDTFTPEQSITKADFVSLLIRTLGLTTADVDSNFTDVDKGDPFYLEVGIARKLGISDGVDINMFYPVVKISRQEMMVLSARALKLTHAASVQGTGTDIDSFSDKSDVASYAADSIASMVKAGIVTGDGSRLNPRDYASRAEAAVIMYRIYKYNK